jgi:hypothetical protein
MLSRRELVTVPLGLVGVTAGLVALRRSWRARARSLAEYGELYWRVARAYSLAAPEELDEELLFEALFGDLDRLSTSAMIEEVQRASRRDFEEANTFVADGWILSRTEGRLSALAALQSGVDPRS